MPQISNILICDMPLRFDTYKGCSHGCEYCFVKLKRDISQIEKGESATSLLNFINKRRRGEVVEKIFDYDIPIHWGGVSDPFQPIEKEKRLSLECLKIFEKTQYPFVVSTKNDLLATDEYLSIIKNCDCAVQYSMVGQSYDIFEKTAPTFLNRVKAISKISKHKRVIVRAQPLIPKIETEFIENLNIFKESGVYGITIEFMKYKYKFANTIRVRGDNCYKYEIIKPIFDRIKKAANELGIKVFAGENRLRQYGDGLNCCGVGDLWKTHDANLNHLLFDYKKIYTNKHHYNILKGANFNFIGGQQCSKRSKLLNSINYIEILNYAMEDKSILSNYTIDKQAYESIKNFNTLTAI